MPIGSTVVYNSGDLILSTVSSSGVTFQENKIAAATSSIILFNSNGLISSQSLNSTTVGTSSYFSGSNIIVSNLTASNITASGTISASRIWAATGYFGQLSSSGPVSISGSNAYIQLLPVGEISIPTNTTASYIYCSGSTNDLYFTQYNGPYTNTTRLRWIESNLYTGILYGGTLSSTPGSTTFNVAAGNGLIVTMNAFTSSAPFPTVNNISWNSSSNTLLYSGSAKITYVGIDSNGQVIQQTNSWGSTDINQWDNAINLGVVLHLSGSVTNGVFNSPQVSYGYPQKTDDFFRAFGPLKISGHTLQASGSVLSIQKTGGVSYREGANYTNNPNHPSTVTENAITSSKIYRYYMSGSTPIIDTGVANAGYTTLDITYYNNNGVLTALGGSYNNQWTIQRVFWIPNSPTNAFIVYYGNAVYTSLIDAVNAVNTEAFTEAPNTALNAIQIGTIVIEGNSTNLTTANKCTIVQAGLFRNVGGIGSGGTTPVVTSLDSLSDVAISSVSQGDLLVYGNGTQWNNTKTLSGSYTLSGSLFSTGTISASSLSGSVFGTSSWATNSVTASYLVPTNNYTVNNLTASGGTFTNDITVNGLTLGKGSGNNTSNTAIGVTALQNNYSSASVGVSNTAIGSNALSSSTSGSYNTALGHLSEYFNTLGDYNTAVGYASLYTNTIGTRNVAVGAATLFSNVSGEYNTALGYQSVYGNVAGLGNTGIGYRTLFSKSSGSYNTAIGYQASNNLTTGSNNIAIGYNAQLSSITSSNEIVIGDNNITLLRIPALGINATTNIFSATNISASGTISASVFSGVYTGSVFGTSSWASNSITASYLVPTNSYQLVNLTASNISASGTGSFNRVGIGTSTLQDILTIGASVSESILMQSNNGGLNILSTGVQITTNLGFLNGSSGNLNFARWGGTSYTEHASVGQSAGPSSYDLQFCAGLQNTGSAINYFTASAVRMTIKTATGNVGIGTTNPSYKLEVAGNISASSFTGSHFGTSSWSTNALTASSLITTNSYQLVNLTASNISASSFTGSFSGSINNAVSASFANTASSLVVGNNYTVTNITSTGTANFATASFTGDVTIPHFTYGNNTGLWVQLDELIQGNQYLGDSERMIVNVYGGAFSDGGMTQYIIKTRSGVSVYKNDINGGVDGHTLKIYQTGSSASTGSTDCYLVGIRIPSGLYYSVQGNAYETQHGKYCKWTTTTETGSGVWTDTNFTSSAFYTNNTSSWATSSLTASSLVQSNSYRITNLTASSISASAITSSNMVVNGNLTVTGSIFASMFSASTIYITSSALIIGDNIITLNAATPAFRYSGIEMYDSGSSTVSSLLWDSLNNYFFVSSSDATASRQIILGPSGEAALPANYIPLISGSNNLTSSVIYQSGSNIGIGTTTPLSKFVVNGGTVNTSSYTTSEARIADGSIHLMKTVAGGVFESIRAMNMDTTAGTTVRVLAASTSDPFNNANGGKVFIDAIRTSTNMDLAFSLNDVAGAAAVERVRFMGSGNVGIGTVSPTGSLHIANSTSTIPVLSLGGGVAAENVSDLYVLNSYNTSSGVGFGAKIIGVNISASLDSSNIPIQRTVWSGVNSATAIVLSADDPGGSQVSAFQIWTSNQGTSGSSLTKKFALTAGGNVGIGVDIPLNKLDVVGNISCSAITASLFFGTSSVANALNSANSYTVNTLTASNQIIYKNAVLLDYSSSALVTSQSNYVVLQNLTGSYNGAFFDYFASSASNFRAGTVIAGWSGSNITYTEYATTDVGGTNQLTMSAAISASYIQLLGNAASSLNWNIKSSGRYL